MSLKYVSFKSSRFYRRLVGSIGERWSAEQEVAGSNPGQTNRVFKLLRRKCYLCNDTCKRLDFLVFSDEDKKP